MIKVRYVKEMHMGYFHRRGGIWNLLLDEFLKYEKGGPNEDKSMLQKWPPQDQKKIFFRFKKNVNKRNPMN